MTIGREAILSSSLLRGSFPCSGAFVGPWQSSVDYWICIRNEENSKPERSIEIFYNLIPPLAPTRADHSDPNEEIRPNRTLITNAPDSIARSFLRLGGTDGKVFRTTQPLRNERLAANCANYPVTKFNESSPER